MAKPPIIHEPFDPLAVENIGVTLALELLEQPVHALPPDERFGGAGIYALYYRGDLPAYGPLVELDTTEGSWRLPVYIGKAMRENAKQGFVARPESKTQLFNRIRAHAKSISQTNLDLKDFRCRYLVLNDAYIGLAEAVLITLFRPAWNGMGLGSNGTGAPRMTGLGSLWDALHPGRKGRPAGDDDRAREAHKKIEESIRALSVRHEDEATARIMEKIRRRLPSDDTNNRQKPTCQSG